MTRMPDLLQELRYAFRKLMKAPGFTIATICVLALGIGANTAIFSVVYTVLLKPLSYHDPDKLVVALHDGRLPVSPADFLDYKSQADAFDQMAAAQAWGGSIAGKDRVEVIPGLQVTANLITMLGVPPQIGRAFALSEEEPGSPRVLLVSHKLWKRQFGADPNIIGRTVRISANEYTIIGVMPPGFQFAPFWQTEAEMWTPLMLGDRVNDRGGRSLRLFARLRSGVSMEQAQSQMDTIARRLAATYPDTNANVGIQLVPLKEKVVGSVKPTLLLLLATVLFVLLIACADVTNLSLTRAVARQKEISLRLAIGASRAQVVRQLAVENMVLAIFGAVSGLALAHIGLGVLNALLPKASLPRQQEITIDVMVFAFTLLSSFAVGIVSGVVPALQASRVDLNESLKAGGRSSTDSIGGQRTRSTLVSAQVSLALLLLVCAGLMIRTLHNLNEVDAGFNPDKLLTFQMFAPESQYDTPQKRTTLFKQVHDRLSTLPGVQSVGAVNHLPLAGDVWSFRYEVVGRPTPPPGRQWSAVYRVVRPGYLETMQIPLLQGRDITERDGPASPSVVIINEAMAARHWPSESPIGKQISQRGSNGDLITSTIIGVIKNARQSEWTGAPADEFYFPYLQRSDSFGASTQTFVIRTMADPTTMIPRAYAEVRAIDRMIPLSQVQSMQRVIEDKLWRSRLSALLLTVFASIALMLAAVGIYGVISCSIRERTREIGIRMALGATAANVLRLILTQSMRPVLTGIVIGIAAALAASRFIRTLLYRVGETDPATFIAVVLGLIVIGTLAACLPARRAIRSDPLTALRE